MSSVRLQLTRTESRLPAQGIDWTVAKDVLDWIAGHGYQPEYGPASPPAPAATTLP